MGFIFIRKSTSDKMLKECETKYEKILSDYKAETGDIIDKYDKTIEEYKHKTKEMLNSYKAESDAIVGEYQSLYNDCMELLDKQSNRNSVNRKRDKAAYTVLTNILNDKKATETAMTAAIEEAVGYLGENLEV